MKAILAILGIVAIVAAYPTIPATPPSMADFYTGSGGQGQDFTTRLYEKGCGSLGFIPTEGHAPPCAAGEVQLATNGPCYAKVNAGTRDIQYIAVHTTASEGTPDGILNYWYNNLGWENPGYHFLFGKEGQIYNLQSPTVYSNGVKGMNNYIINVSWIGGSKSTDDRTEAQKTSLRRFVKRLKANFPNAIIQGHRDFPNVTKSCPCFSAGAEYGDIVAEDQAIGEAWAKLSNNTGSNPDNGNTNTGGNTDGGNTNTGGTTDGGNTNTGGSNSTGSNNTNNTTNSTGLGLDMSTLMFVGMIVCGCALLYLTFTNKKTSGGLPVQSYMPMNANMTQMGMTQGMMN